MKIISTFEISDPVEDVAEESIKDERTKVTQEDYDNIKKFTEGLQKLMEETGCSVSSCGCCNSPWLIYKGGVY